MTGAALVFLDDARAREFAPFALTRPCCELRAGAELIRRRWEIALGQETAGFVSAPHLADFEEPWGCLPLRRSLPRGAIVVNSRCAVALRAADRAADLWRCEGRVAAVRLSAPVEPEHLADHPSLDTLVRPTARESTVAGWWLDQVWDLVRHLPAMLGDDVPALAERLGCAPRADVTRVGAHPVLVEEGATVEPLVVFDVTAGPVLVRRGAAVQAFTRLVGPCYVAEGTAIAGGRVATASLGEACRVHGELSTSILLGHANKSHDGFLGHSVLGRWVNLGAGTTNSNLKNTYGSVALWTPRGVEDTGLQFLGAFVGDHAKTAIGTRLTTGCVIGAGANVIGSGLGPRVIPPFAWSAGGSEAWELERFLATAERMMRRRSVTMSAAMRRLLSAAWHQQWSTAG
ncbi:MAG TPA: putative sugar nucleotidyl transferase [Gemmatimonadaceae bacterium]|nr:putative sugar nucleotidyl transferase [Gemmatimonadaceae bacterium]